MQTIILKLSSSVRALVIPLCYIVMLLFRLDTYLYRGGLATRLDFYNTYSYIFPFCSYKMSQDITHSRHCCRLYSYSPLGGLRITHFSSSLDFPDGFLIFNLRLKNLQYMITWKILQITYVYFTLVLQNFLCLLRALFLPQFSSYTSNILVSAGKYYTQEYDTYIPVSLTWKWNRKSDT